MERLCVALALIVGAPPIGACDDEFECDVSTFCFSASLATPYCLVLEASATTEKKENSNKAARMTITLSRSAFRRSFVVPSVTSMCLGFLVCKQGFPWLVGSSPMAFCCDGFERQQWRTQV